MNESVQTDEKVLDKEQDVVEVIDAEQNGEMNQAEDSEQEEVHSELETVKEEKDEIHQRMLRVQAEFDNFKKRTQREKAADLKYKSQDLISELLPALDNFERALEVETTDATKGIVEGITMVYNQLKSALESQGVEVIETVGHEFDSNLHHAVMQVEDEELESNVVTEELQKGYMLKDRVIRAAMVKVNK